MAGTIQALLLRSSERSAALPTVPLAGGTGLVLLPLTDEIVASLIPASASDTPVEGFYELTSGVAEWARLFSRYGEVAYLHSEFFGGSGFHAAIAWRDESVGWGPMFTATADGEAEDHYETMADPRDMAANVLLRRLGVDRSGHFDEFAAAGLDRHRWTDDWAATL
jgi:hypothetical protein